MMLEDKLRKPAKNLSKAVADMDTYSRKHGTKTGRYKDLKAKVRMAEVELIKTVLEYFLGVNNG